MIYLEWISGAGFCSNDLGLTPGHVPLSWTFGRESIRVGESLHLGPEGAGFSWAPHLLEGVLWCTGAAGKWAPESFPPPGARVGLGAGARVSWLWDPWLHLAGDSLLPVEPSFSLYYYPMLQALWWQ